MTISKIRTMAAAMLLAGVWSASSAQNSVSFTNVAPGEEISGWGTGRAEKYDVAVHIPYGLFSDAKVSGFEFMMQSTAEMSGCSGWVAAELGVSGGSVSADITAKEVTVSADRISVTLPEEYTVGEQGVYIGVSFTMDSKESAEAKKPVSVIPSNEYGLGMYAHTSRTYGKWTDIEALLSVTPAVRITLTGMAAEAATIALPADILAVSGEQTPIKATLTNSGSANIESLTIAYTRDGETVTSIEQFPGGGDGGYMTTVPVELTLPAFSGKGTSEVSVAVTEVNGLPNSLAEERSTTSLSLVSFRPEHRPLLEEYTGAQCGYCPRGEVGMEKMKELYGGRFIGVAYHVGDIMSIMEEADFPNPAPAQPVAWLSRHVETDPYFGALPLNSKTFGFDAVWEAEEAAFAEASLSVEAAWREEERENIDITSEAVFIRDHSEADFRIAYLLVADGLKGEEGDPRWRQGNYYSGEVDVWPEDFDFLVEAPQWIENAIYNNVVISAPDVKGIEGSIPASVNADEKIQHRGALAMSDAVNTDGMTLVQDKSRMRVVALLIDARDGRVVNAAEAIPTEYNAVNAVYGAADIVSTAYYDTCGRRMTAPGKGVSIRVTRYSDGSVKAEKILR